MPPQGVRGSVFYMELCMSQVLNEFVSLESFGFMQDGSLLGYRLEDIEPELRCLIPRLDPSYVFEKDALSIMSAWFEIGSSEPLFILSLTPKSLGPQSAFGFN